VRTKSIRLREPCTQVEFCAAPVLTGHSGDSGKDESSAKTWDNDRVQTFVSGRAKEARSVDVARPFRGGGAAPEGTEPSPPVAPTSLLPVVVLHIYVLPYFVADCS
jgi:hypothetical protein